MQKTLHHSQARNSLLNQNVFWSRLLLLLPLLIVNLYTTAQSITGNSSVCQNQEVTYNVTGIAWPNWQVTGGLIVGGGTGTSVTISWQQAGTGNLSAQGTEGTANYAVTVNPSPNPQMAMVQSLNCGVGKATSGIGSVSLVSLEDPREQQLLGGLCLQACEQNTYTYYVANTPGSTFNWQVNGAVDQTVNGNQITVTWGDPAAASLTVTETNASGCSATITQCVEVIEAPEALFTALPEPVNNIVNVCRNQDVSFFDLSIGGTNWSWDFGDGTSSTAQNPIHSFGQPGTYYVTLTVGNGANYNGHIKGYFDVIRVTKLGADLACNCTATYTMTVVVAPDAGPKIECISTICAKSTQTYSTPADCNNYNWTVNGGTITDETDNTVTVEWGDGSEIPSYISLDVGNCSGYCSAPTVAVVPIIPSVLIVSGPDSVCYGSYASYTVPQIAGLTYDWTVQGGIIASGDGTNQIRVYWGPSFYGEKTYEIKLEFKNELLGCGGTGSYKVTIIPDLSIINVNRALICENGSNTSLTPITLVNNFDETEVKANWTVVTPSGVTLTDVVTASSTFEPFTYSYGPGTYTITATPVTGNYCEDQEVAEVVVSANPAAPYSITGETDICAGQTFTYTANSSSTGTYVWSVNGGTIQSTNGSNVSVKWDGTAPYQLSVYIVNEQGCQSPSTSIAPSVIQPSVAPAITGPIQACLGSGSIYQFAGTLDPSLTYNWTVTPSTLGNISTPADGNQISVAWNLNGGNAANAQITLTVTSPCGETSTSSINVNLSLPNVDFTVPAGVCEGESINLNYPDPTASVTWNINAVNVAVNQNTYSYATTESGIVQITMLVTDQNGCMDEATHNVTIHPAPKAKIITKQNVNYYECLGDGPINNELEAIQPTSPVGITVDWYVTGNPSSIGSGNLITVNSVGSYYATFTNEFGCTATSTPLVINYIPCGTGGTGGCNPEAHTADFSSVAIDGQCDQYSFTSSVSPNVSIVNWTYQTSEGAVTVFSTDANPTVTLPDAGSYEIRMNYTYPCTDPVTGIVGQVPFFKRYQIFLPLVADFSYSTTCTATGSQVQFKDESGYFVGGEVDQYEWSINGNIVSTAQEPSLVLAEGTYLVEFHISNSVTGIECTESREITITGGQPVASMTFAQEVCAGTPVTFTSTSTGSNISSWNWELGSVDATANTAVTTRIFNTAGTYSISLTVENLWGCSNTATGEITVLGTENGVIVADGSLELCQGQSVNLTAPSGSAYLWSNGQTTQQITVSTSGVYSVELSGTNGCAYRTASVAVNVRAPQPLNITGQVSYCYPENVAVTASPGFSNYFWSVDYFPYDNIPEVAYYSNNNFAVGLTPGTYRLQVNAIDPNGCPSASSGMEVTVNDSPLNPIVVPNNPEEFPCAGNPITLSVDHPEQGVTYQWSTGQVGTSIVVSQAGTYTVSAESVNGCRSEGFRGYTIYPTPDVSAFMSGCYTICEEDAPLTVNGIAGLENTWYIKDRNVSTLVGFGERFSINQSGTYYVVVSNGICEATSETISVDIVPSPAVYITATEDQLCDGATATLVAHGAVSYVWYKNGVEVGTGSTLSVTAINGDVYEVRGTDNGLGCSATAQYQLYVLGYTATATIDCCEDEVVCSGSSASIPVHFTGVAPWTFTYTDGVNQYTVTTTDNPYNLQVSPSATTTYSLVNVYGAAYGCSEVCGKATVAVKACTPPVQPSKGKKLQDCSKNCFSTTVLNVVETGNCQKVTLRVSCNNACDAALSHFSVSIPCGTISNMSNSLGFPMSATHKDPTSGLSGFKVDDIQDFCEGRTAESFDVSYTVCFGNSDCGNGDFCPPMVGYKAGTCVNYGIATNPQAFKNMESENQESETNRLGVYPNPFSQETNVLFDLNKTADVNLIVYDLNGKLVSTLYQGQLEAGTHTILWDGSGDQNNELNTGVYLIALTIEGNSQYMKVMLNK